MSPVRLKKCQGRCAQVKRHDEFWRDSQQADGRMTRCIECVKEERIDRAERRRNGETLPAISEEERERRSERMKALHAEGRAGPEYGRLGGRPRKPKINDAILEHFRERSHLVVNAIEANLRSKNKSHRMRAAEHLSKLEIEVEKAARAARGAGKSPDEMTQEELEEFVAQGVAALIEKGELPITLPDSAIQDVTAA